MFETSQRDVHEIVAELPGDVDSLDMPNRAARADVVLVALAFGVIALGLWLRIQALGIPLGLAWDEHHFVNNAQNYLAGKADWNDHPPLGKLFMALAIRALGDNSFAWRLPSLILGILSIGWAALLAKRLFGGWRAPLLAAAFVAGDGFFIAYSRTALLDGMLASFTLAIAAIVVGARRAWHVGFAAFLIGVGCAIKLSLLPFVLPLALVCLLPNRAPRWSLALIAIAPIVYGAIWSYGLAITNRAYGVAAVIEATRDMVAHHAALNEWKHPYLSHWYTWVIPTKPLNMRFDQFGNLVRTMSSMGNPLLWWAASISLLATLLAVLGALFTSLRSRARARTALRGIEPGDVWLLGFWLLLIVPWIVSDRDSYIYHYLPAYGFGVILVAGKIARFIARRALLGAALAGTILILSFWMAPVWGELPVSRRGYAMRLWFPGWRHKLTPPPGV